MGSRRPRKKGYRQGHLKRFHGEFINAGMKANSAFLQESFARVNSMKNEDVGVIHYEKKREVYRQTCILKSEPRDVILGKLKGLWQTDFWQGVDEFFRLNLILSEGRNLFLFFSGDRWFFVGETFEPSTYERYQVKRSIIYPSKRVAFMHYRAAKITWVEKKDLNVPLLDR